MRQCLEEFNIGSKSSEHLPLLHSCWHTLQQSSKHVTAMTSYAITKFRGGRTWSHVHKILLTRFLNYWFSIEFLRVCPLRVFLHLRVKDWAKPLDQTPLNPGIFAAFAPILYGWSRRVHLLKQVTKRAKYSWSPAMEQMTLWQWLCWSRLGPPFGSFKRARNDNWPRDFFQEVTSCTSYLLCTKL